MATRLYLIRHGAPVIREIVEAHPDVLFNDVSHNRQEPSAVKASLSKWWDTGSLR